MTSDIEQKWFQRAHKIATDGEHLNETNQRGGSPGVPELDGKWLRWPGYLGDDVQAGSCVLAIANVHRGFHSGTMTKLPGGYEAVKRLVGSTERLSQLQAGDATPLDVERYIEGHRPAYQLGLSGGWRVRTHLINALSACGLVPSRPAGLGSLAYVNASCCQVPEDEKLARPSWTKTKLKTSCLKNHPVTDVVEMLRPRVILCMSAGAGKQLQAADLGASTLVSFHQLNGTLSVPVTLNGRHLAKGTRVADWSEALRGLS